MVDLEPVRAWHPNRSVADPSSLVCPVYDTLGPDDFARYAPRPYNAASFVPRPAHVPLPQFLKSAVDSLDRAVRDGAYVRDPRPGFYIYGIRYVPPPDVLEALEPADRRPSYLLLGLVGTLNFEKLVHGQVALHERTFSDRVAERVALTGATGMSFAPILAGYHAADHRLNDLLEEILGLHRRALSFEGGRAPDVEATIADTTHRLWRLDDPDRVATLAQSVRPLRLLILDGHHRFTAAARRHYEGHRSAPLVMLVDGGDRALQLLPWHRVLPPQAVAPETVLERARAEFSSVVELGALAGPEAAIARLHRMRKEGTRGFIVRAPSASLEVRLPSSDDAGADFEGLHGFLDASLSVDPEGLTFVRSPRAAWAAVDPESGSVPGGTLFLLPGLNTRGVEARAFDRGEVMAQKSTMFLPKVAEGMIFAPAGGEESST